MTTKADKKKAQKEAKRLEKIKAEELFVKQLRFDALKREISIQNVKRDQLHRDWHKMLMNMKVPKMIEGVEMMRKYFLRTCDKRDFLITHILNLINTADIQYSRCFTNFCETIDSLIKKFIEELEHYEKQNKINQAALLKRNEIEDDLIKINHDAAETHLQLLLYHKNTTHDSEMWINRGKNLVKEDYDRDEYTNVREYLLSYLENIYCNVWDSKKAIISSYLANIQENQKEGRKLRKKENEMMDIIARQGKMIESSDSVVRKLRNELLFYENGTKQSLYRDKYTRYSQTFKRLKKEFIKSCELDRKNMDILVNESKNALNKLTEDHAKVTKILKLAALCRKHETLHEKVLPFGKNEVDIELQKVRPSVSPTMSNTTEISTTPGQILFLQKISKAELIKRALTHEKELLEKENEKLIQDYAVYQAKSLKIQPKCICSSLNFKTTSNRFKNA